MTSKNTKKQLHKDNPLVLTLFNDIISLRHAVQELKNIHIQLWSISIGKPKLSKLNQIQLPTGKLYAFFSLEKPLNTLTEEPLLAIVKKYKGLVWKNRIVLN